MAESKKSGAKAAEKGKTLAKRVTINGQYIKDLSFENPQAPKSLFALKERPQIDIAVDLKATKMQEHVFEVAIKITSKALSNDILLFLVEVAYAGIFTLSDAVKDNEEERVLLIDCAQVLFPFLRRIVADVTRDGGFPPLMLDPIDFEGLFEERKDHIKRQKAAS